MEDPVPGIVVSTYWPWTHVYVHAERQSHTGMDRGDGRHAPCRTTVSDDISWRADGMRMGVEPQPEAVACQRRVAVSRGGFVPPWVWGEP